MIFPFHSVNVNNYIGLTLESQSTLLLEWPTILIGPGVSYILVISLKVLHSRKPRQDSWSPYLHPLYKPNLAIMYILFYMVWFAYFFFRIFASMFMNEIGFFSYTYLSSFAIKIMLALSNELGNVSSLNFLE